MLRANGIVPQNPEPLEPQEHVPDTPPTSEASSGKREHSKVKKEVESRTKDEDGLRERNSPFGTLYISCSELLTVYH
jgi:hypothetical protein